MKSNFKDIVNSEEVVLVDFFGTWCGPCQTLMPILKEVKDELGDHIKIVKIDIDKNRELATQYQVRSVPTMILFKTLTNKIGFKNCSGRWLPLVY